MRWNTTIKWIMIVSGVLTSTMLYAAIAPQAALRSTFGDSLTGPVSEVVVRNWGILIGLVGAMLVYGAFNPVVRPLVLIVAGLSKLAFIGLIVFYGPQYLGKAALPIVIDSVMVAIFVAYLLSTRRRVEAPVPSAA
jgi:hypothetical protein